KPSFIWSSSGAGGRTNTVINAYVNGAAVDLSSLAANGGKQQNINFDMPNNCDPNNRLNAVCSNQPTANAGSNITTCGDAHLTGQRGGGATTSTWSSSGTGTFDDASALNTTYHPTATDIGLGSVTLTLTTNN